MNIIVYLVTGILIGSYVMLVGERMLLVKQAVYALERKKKQFYLVDGLLMYGVALLKEGQKLQAHSLCYNDHQAHLSYTYKKNKRFTLEGTITIDGILSKGSCRGVYNGKDIAIVSWHIE